MSYEQWRKDWSPAWLRRTYGDAWQGAHGRLADVLAARMRAGVKSAFPGEAPADALPYLGDEIGIPRSPYDTDDVYAEKLRRAWEVWPFAGTPLGMLLAFEAAGYLAGQVVIVQQEAHGFTLDTNTALAPEERLTVVDLMGARWTFGGGNVRWNRFGILFPDSANLPTWWTGIASPPTTITAPTIGEVNGMIRLVNKWRRAAAAFQWIRVCTSGNVWGWPVTLDWGAPGLVWGATMIEWGPAEY